MKEKVFNKGLSFIKTEKEIYDRLCDLVKRIDERCAEIQANLKAMRTLIGTDPDIETQYYGFDYSSIVENMDDAENKYYKVYSIDYSQLNNDTEPTLTNFFIVSKPKQNNMDIMNIKRKYNELIHKYYDLMNEKKKIEKRKSIIDPKSNRKHKLNERELIEFGF